MGLYRDWILPRCIDWALGAPEFAELRREVTPGLAGRVLEIGFGSGRNLPFYPPEVERVLALDPQTAGRRLAAKRLREADVPVEFVELGEDGSYPLADGSVDSVLSTWTLCSIADLARALAEVRRVLVPGGRFHFLEHGRAPDARVARWQRRLNPVQRVVAGGCRLDLDPEPPLRGAGLELTDLESFYARGPRVASYTYRGVALAPGA